jgi:hypothetical protein
MLPFLAYLEAINGLVDRAMTDNATSRSAAMKPS